MVRGVLGSPQRYAWVLGTRKGDGYKEGHWVLSVFRALSGIQSGVGENSGSHLTHFAGVGMSLLICVGLSYLDNAKRSSTAYFYVGK